MNQVPLFDRLLSSLDSLRFWKAPAYEMLSFPKSGSTWLRLMLADALIRHYDLPESSRTILVQEICEKYPGLPNLRQSHPFAPILLENGYQPDPALVFQIRRLPLSRRARVLHLARDPRDVVVSYFHQVTLRSDVPMQFAAIDDFVRHPVYGISRIIAFDNLVYSNRPLVADYFLFYYEELLADTESILAKVCRFIGLDIGGEILRKVVSDASATRVRSDEQKGAIKGMRSFGAHENALKVRKARAGTFREELSEDLIAYCDSCLNALHPELRARLNALGHE